MAEQTSDTPTEDASVSQDVAPTNGAREPASDAEAPTGGAEGAAVRETADAIDPAASGAPGAEAPAEDEAAERRAPPPGRGPVVLADERGKPEPKPPVAPRRGKAAPKPKPPRRRKRSAAERHRAVFFARLNELRRGERTEDGSSDEEVKLDEAVEGRGEEAAPAEQAAAEEPVAEVQAVEEPAAEEPAAEEPAAEEPVAEVQAAAPESGESVAEGPGAEQPATGRRAAPPPPVSQARMAAAIQRVGGPEIVEEALRPKMDEQGERKKWALVCCEAAQGRQAGDPEFTAWLRLAATPVREIKASLPVREEQGRGGGPGRGGDRGRGGGDRGPGGGPGRGGDRGRPGRGDRVSREELEAFARGGTLTSKVRIVDPAAEKRERESQRKEERERKRQAERERLARLGY